MPWNLYQSLQGGCWAQQGPRGPWQRCRQAALRSGLAWLHGLGGPSQTAGGCPGRVEHWTLSRVGPHARRPEVWRRQGRAAGWGQPLERDRHVQDPQIAPLRA
jgi:hypothetical protein